MGGDKSHPHRAVSARPEQRDEQKGEREGRERAGVRSANDTDIRGRRDCMGNADALQTGYIGAPRFSPSARARC